jgi:small subunit ribosomal protein S1
MEEAMKQTGALPFAPGNIVKGTIIEVRPKEVLVDIGYKSEGVISGGEFDDIKTVKTGDEIDVLIEKLEDKDGMVVLSKEKAEFKKNWERILTICNEGGTIAGSVKAIVKGGLLVNIGSRLSCPPPKSTSAFPRTSPSTSATLTISRSSKLTRIGRTSSCHAASSSSRSGSNDVRSSCRDDPWGHPQGHGQEHHRLWRVHRPQRHRRTPAHHRHELGTHRSPFRDFESRPGHRRRSPRHQPRKGTRQPRSEAEAGKSLGQHRAEVPGRCQGQRQGGQPGSYGAFVELEPACEGLVHVTELSWTKRIAKPSDVLKPDRRSKRWCSASTAKSRRSPWACASSRPILGSALREIPAGTHVKGKVRNLTSYGAFIELEEGLDGMIHVSDISWTARSIILQKF